MVQIIFSSLQEYRCLCLSLAGLTNPEVLIQSSPWGEYPRRPLFFHSTGPRVWLQIHKSRLFCRCTNTGKEVDFVIAYGQKIIGIEVKSATNVRFRDAENLTVFLDEHPDWAVRLRGCDWNYGLYRK